MLSIQYVTYAEVRAESQRRCYKTHAGFLLEKPASLKLKDPGDLKPAGREKLNRLGIYLHGVLVESARSTYHAIVSFTDPHLNRRREKILCRVYTWATGVYFVLLTAQGLEVIYLEDLFGGTNSVIL